MFAHYPKDHSWCGINPKKRMDRVALFTKFGDLITVDHQIHTYNSKEFIKACEETNGVAERDVGRVKEGTAIALGQSGPPEEW